MPRSTRLLAPPTTQRLARPIPILWIWLRRFLTVLESFRGGGKPPPLFRPVKGLYFFCLFTKCGENRSGKIDFWYRSELPDRKFFRTKNLVNSAVRPGSLRSEPADGTAPPQYTDTRQTETPLYTALRACAARWRRELNIVVYSDCIIG